MPINKPLTPKIAGAISRMRSREAVRSCKEGENFGARMVPTNWREKNSDTRLVRQRISNTRLIRADARSQAFLRSSLAKKAVNVGTKAEARAPPAIRLKSKSVKVEAALKASSTFSVPKALKIRIWRNSPVRLLNTKAAMIVPAARAIWRLAERGETITMRDYIRDRMVASILPGKPHAKPRTSKQ